VSLRDNSREARDRGLAILSLAFAMTTQVEDGRELSYVTIGCYARAMSNTAEHAKVSPAELLDAGIAIFVAQAVQAGIILGLVDQALLQDDSKAFRGDPGRSLTYESLRAIQERAVVSAAEAIKLFGAESPNNLSLGQRHRAQVCNYRHVLSHPFRTRFQDPDAQRFYEAHGQFVDARVGMIWAVACELQDELALLGRRCASTNFSVTAEMGAIYELILRRMVTPTAAEQIKPFELMDTLQMFSERYLSWAAKHFVNVDLSTAESYK
jgi:hypothetical protein